MAEEEKKSTTESSEQEKDKEKAAKEPAPPVETQHRLEIEGRILSYTAQTGMMPIRNDEGEIEANMFYTAYTLDGTEDAAERPLVFAFNGGPGSSSVWLHMGAIGPWRVQMQEPEGWMPASPYRLVPNEQTWLDAADLVFIDPVGTGYSRAAKSDLNSKFWSLKGDIDSVAEFIRLYLTRNKRWRSPIFLAGESYGTTRAAGLSGALVDKGIALNGIVLISTILNMQTARFTVGNDLPFQLFLPTYTATAWYHKKLPSDLQARPLAEVVAEVEAWAAGPYALALMQGDNLSKTERNKIVRTLARYTGLSRDYVDQANLRILIFRFCKELLRDQRRTVGRLDSRYQGIDAEPVSEYSDFDPAHAAITPPYTTLFNDYVRSKLGYENDDEYRILSFEVNRKWEYERGQFPDTSDAMRSALSKNPHMYVLACQGYYDLATPHFAAQYTFKHMRLDPELQNHIEMKMYEAGHMFYLETGSLAQFRADVGEFISNHARTS